MRKTLASIVLSLALLMLPACAGAQPTVAAEPTAAPTTAPARGKLPHIQVDVKKRQVRVDAETLAVDAPLEFFCVTSGTNEHESVIRTPAKPANIHLALVMIGLEPGTPVQFSEATKTWLPPHGPPLQITMEYEQNGKPASVPAYRWMRDIRTKKEMPPTHWIFAGSRVMEDGNYAADVTGYVVSIVNFDLTMIDLPQVASNANETLAWERNPDVAAPMGAKVTMIIEPVGGGGDEAGAAATRPSQPNGPRPGATQPSTIGDVVADEKLIAALREKWEKAVLPHGAQLRQAAQTHYDVLASLRREQQRLIDEADKLQRLIEDLERRYQDLTTPRPEPVTP